MCGPVDDTLHTPQVFPQINQHHEHRRIDPPTAPTLDPPHCDNDCPTIQQSRNNNKDSSVQLLLRLPDGKLVKLSAVEMAENESSSTSTSVLTMVIMENIFYLQY